MILGAASTLNMELGGTTPGAQYDQLLVSGALSLDGALEVSLINGLSPVAGQSFNLLDWGSLAGAFSSLSLPHLTGLVWNTSQLYASGVVSVAPALTADFDEDGDVDAADLVKWQVGYGVSGTATHLQGDADGDHDVDGGDFLAWQRQLGAGTPVAAAVASAPEPGTLSLVAMSVLGLAIRAGRRPQCSQD